MKFGSWTHDGDRLDIDFYNNDSAIDITEYVPSNEWALVAHPAEKKIVYYACCTEPYPDLRFYIKLKRIAVFYNYILVLPCVLLSFLTLVIFWLPPESPAKMMLGRFLLIVASLSIGWSPDRSSFFFLVHSFLHSFLHFLEPINWWWWWFVNLSALCLRKLDPCYKITPISPTPYR